MGYSPRDRRESDMIERLRTHSTEQFQIKMCRGKILRKDAPRRGFMFQTGSLGSRRLTLPCAR